MEAHMNNCLAVPKTVVTFHTEHEKASVHEVEKGEEVFVCHPVHGYCAPISSIQHHFKTCREK